jgi:hypothetical protein
MDDDDDGGAVPPQVQSEDSLLAEQLMREDLDSMAASLALALELQREEEEAMHGDPGVEQPDVDNMTCARPRCGRRTSRDSVNLRSRLLSRCMCQRRTTAEWCC